MAGSVNNDVTLRQTAGVNTQLKPFSEETKRLQAEINQAIDEGKLPGPKLKEDGIEGPKTRAKLQEYQTVARPEELKSATAVATAQAQTDRLESKDPTVGEYVEGQVRAFGKELQEDAQLSAIMLTPGLNVVAGVIMTRHMNQARERIAKLPMDPDGNWKKEAAKIFDEERQGAREEILALPGKAAQGVVDGVNTAIDTVDKAVDQGVEAAKGVWNGATGKVAEAWSYAKEAVPRAFKEVATDAQVAAVMANPLFAAPSAIILKNHMAKAYDRIMKLPMDPDGKWKQEAAKIRDEEMGAAKQEILDLPHRALDTVVDTATGIYEGAKKGLTIAGTLIGQEVQREVNEVKREVKEVRHGIGGFFGAIANGLARFGKWVAG
ncbi:MAG TPA: hypothetical protein V6D05_14505 [Stenomitos sp.]